MNRPVRSLIVAMTRDRVIGLNGKMPWHISGDLKLFKKLTMGNTVIMGRRTFESLGRPLPGRNNIVVSRTLKPSDGIEVFPELKEAVDRAEQLGKEIFFIGGGEIYKQALGLCDKMYITWVKGNYQGDTFFPEVDMGEWEKVQEFDFPEFIQITYLKKTESRDRAMIHEMQQRRL